MNRIETPDEISSTEISQEASKFIDAGVLLEVRPYGGNASINVETVIFPGGRAAQAVNGNAVWGAWSPTQECLIEDETGNRFGLNGLMTPEVSA